MNFYRILSMLEKTNPIRISKTGFIDIIKQAASCKLLHVYMKTQLCRHTPRAQLDVEKIGLHIHIFHLVSPRRPLISATIYLNLHSVISTILVITHSGKMNPKNLLVTFYEFLKHLPHK